ncbi:MAG TPA: NADH-quinone oxidoreductase subunit C [Pseudobacteroides sp.]|uniref:hydrogenase large subunit n=1 Tax=Pseudobacteroides sp. TaxID=1968840 RepID=UPI002F947A52
MKLVKYFDDLKKNFANDILSHTIKTQSEIYISVNNSRILDISAHIRDEMNGTLVSLFANDERLIDEKFAIYYVFAVRENGYHIVLKTLIDENNPVFNSISNQIHGAHLYEREIQDMYGLKPLGHPSPKNLVFHGNWPMDIHPLRKEFDIKTKPPFVNYEQEFIEVQGTGVFEIPVGPVHAGIIEPGHFRFSVAGEPIINLEAQLFFVHKGIEKLCEGQSIDKCFYISERISGDETFSNSLAYCMAIEKIAGIEVPERANHQRVLFAELERLVSHLGDLAGICIDVAFGFAAFQFRMLRGWTYQIIEEVSGSRFLRSVNRPGGVRKDFTNGKEKRILEYMDKIRNELAETEKIILSNSLFIDRVENTGVLTYQQAVDMNAVGPGGRAAGVRNDVRKDFPYCTYGKLKFSVPEHNNGDVNCRMKVKLEECYQSIFLIEQVVNKMRAGKIIETIGRVDPYKAAIGCTESPRGENVHWIMTGENNTIFRYKIRTPSFCSWPAVCLAVQGNIVPDFPLINKSFNLSYAGNDL